MEEGVIEGGSLDADPDPPPPPPQRARGRLEEKDSCWAEN